MPQVINTNVMSLNAQRNLNKTQSALQTSLERLSSGLRINKAKDDAAGLAIAETMNSQIRGLKMAIRNANDGISFVQTAEGGLDEVTNALQRMRELAVQSANGTYGASTVASTARANLDAEFQALSSEITRIVDTTKFNDTKVINEATNNFKIQVGFENNENDSITISGVDADRDDVATALGKDITTGKNAGEALSAIDDAISQVTSDRAALGALQNRFESTVRNLENIVENTSAAKSRIMDADFAAETAALTRAQILQQSGAAMLAQANAIPQNVLTLLR